MIEINTKTPWWLIPICYVPVFCYLITQFETSAAVSIALCISGTTIWTLAEYLLHRFIFHGEDNWMEYINLNNYIITAHFIIHGIHHAFPQDALRLVFPPFAGYNVIGGFVYLPMTLFLPYYLSQPLFFGALCGYIIYDLVHYFFHHSNPTDGWFKEMKVYHMQHHYKFG